MVDETKLPVYDDKVELILEKLKSNTREAVAQELGYSSYKSLDIYMRRKNFRWNPDTQNYVPEIDRVKEILDEVDIAAPAKVGRIIDRIKEGEDLREVAKEEGFKGLKEMAEYMKSKGYIWSEEKGNYINILKVEEKKERKRAKGVINVKGEEDRKANTDENVKLQIGDEYMELLNILLKNKEKLLQILNEDAHEGTIPRYTVPGEKKSKSYYISTILGKLLKEFSKEKNVSISECIEGALVEYLRKYGYKKEIDRIFRV